MKKVLFLSLTGVVFNSCGQFQAPPEIEEPSRFITLDVPADFEKSNEEYWLFVSDNDGTLLDLEEIQNNSTISLEIPGDIKSSRVMVSVFFYASFETTLHRRIQTYTEIRPGNYNLTATPDSALNLAQAKLTFGNSTSDLRLHLRGDILQYKGNDNLIECDIVLNKNDQANLMANALNIKTQEWRYKFLTLSPDMHAMADYNSFKSFEMKELEIPGGDRHDIVQRIAYGGKEYVVHSNHLESGDGNPIMYPVFSSDEFDHYITSLGIYNGSQFESFLYRGKEPMKTVTRMNTTATLASSNTDGFVLNVTGNADVVGVANYHSVKEGTIDVEESRLVYMPVASQISVRHPQLPSVLQARYYPLGERMEPINEIFFADFGIVDSYDALIELSFDQHQSKTLVAGVQSKLVRL